MQSCTVTWRASTTSRGEFLSFYILISFILNFWLWLAFAFFFCCTIFLLWVECTFPTAFGRIYRMNVTIGEFFFFTLLCAMGRASYSFIYLSTRMLLLFYFYFYFTHKLLLYSYGYIYILYCFIGFSILPLLTSFFSLLILLHFCFCS